MVITYTLNDNLVESALNYEYVYSLQYMTIFYQLKAIVIMVFESNIYFENIYLLVWRVSCKRVM